MSLMLSETSELCEKGNLQDLLNCFKPTITTWNQLQPRRSDIPQVLFSLFTYSLEDLNWLCSDYRWMRGSCYNPKMLSACVGHPYVSFFESQLAFGCSTQRATEIQSNFECIRTVTLNSTSCLTMIKGRYSPGGDASKCLNSLNYFNCMADKLRDNCGNSSLDVFQSAIEHFGCLATISRTTNSTPIDISKS